MSKESRQKAFDIVNDIVEIYSDGVSSGKDTEKVAQEVLLKGSKLIREYAQEHAIVVIGEDEELPDGTAAWTSGVMTENSLRAIQRRNNKI